MKTNFAKMSTKKLTGMLETANDEDRIEIENILSQRNTSPEGESDNVSSDDNLSDEDKQFLAELDKDATDDDKKSSNKKSNKSNKMTYEEAVTLAESLKQNVGHICKVVPFNTIEWVDGVIRGIIADKRSNKVLYAIHTDDGRNIVKAHDSKMLQISEETTEITRRTRSTSPSEKLDDAALLLKAEESAIYVGRIVSFAPTKEVLIYDEESNKTKEVEKLDGVITAIVPDKRSGRILYRIESTFEAYDKNVNKNITQKVVVHKVSTASDVQISEEYNEEIRSKYIARKESYEMKKNMTPEDALKSAQASYKKAVKDFEKAQKALEARTKDLEDAKIAYAQFVENQPVAQQVENETVANDELA